MTLSDALSWVGAIAGAAGSVMGFVAFKRSGKFKAIDLRLGLRKAQFTLSADIDEVRQLFDRGKISRERIA